jgi:vacuolar protein sorting-associated protein VTA1
VAEDDPELQAIMSGQMPQPATVEDAPEEGEPSTGHLDPNAATGGSSFTPAPVSAPTSPPQGSAAAPDQVSPIVPADQATPDSYFPSAPSAAAADQDPPLELPSAPTTVGDPDLRAPSPPTVLPSAPSPTVQPPSAPFPAVSPPTLPDTPNDFYRPAPISPPAPPASQSQPQAPPSSYTPQPPAPPSNCYQHQSQQPVVPTFSPPAPTAPAPAPISQPTSAYSGAPPTNAAYNADDMAMAMAQKHAKWAISALNFEDVPTAVRELKAALAVLGAQ